MAFIINKTTCFGLSSGHHRVLTKFLLQEITYNLRNRVLMLRSYRLHALSS